MAKTYEDSNGKVFSSQEEAANSNTALGTNPINTNINSQNLSSSNPMKVTSPTPSTEAAGLGATIEEQAKQYADSVVPADTIANEKVAKEGAFKKLTNFITGNKGQTALTDEAYSSAVDPAKKELNDINNQILSEQVGLRRRLEALDKNPQGLFGGALEQEKRRVENESIAKQADLSVIQMAKQNNYFGAKEIADRKVSAQLESDANTLKALEFTYQENKDAFTKDEQRQFEANQSERKRLLDEKRDELTKVNDLAIEALKKGAPVSVVRKMQQATTQSEALSIGGSYLGPKGDAISTQVVDVNGRKLLINSKTGETIREIGAGETPGQTTQLARDKANIDQISELTGNGLATSAVGTSGASRATTGFWKTLGSIVSVVGIPARINSGIQKLTGKQQNFIAGIEQLRSGLNLDTLIEAKSRGATFGALSDQELQVLSSSATKLGTWAIKDKDGNVIGYNTTENKFKEEMDKINNFAKLDYIVKGGDPGDVGANIMPDGTVWVTNSDGTFTQIK